MVHNLWLMMSLSGSVILIFYILLYPIAKRYFSVAWRYRVLKVSLAFYLIPFPACLSGIRNIIVGFFPQTVGIFCKPDILWNTSCAIYLYGDSVHVSSGLEKMLIVMLGSGIFSLTVILLYVLRYWKTRKICLKYSNIPIEQERQDSFNILKKEVGIRRNVKLLCSQYCKTPITIGIHSLAVIIPPWDESETGKDLYQDVLKHELLHIKHGDLLIKFFGMTAMAVHWFNPFVYILYREISNISEIYCDSIVLEEKEEKARKAYGELLLRLATEKSFANNDFTVGILGGSSKKDFKRRILEMKTVRKNKKILSAAATALICVMSVGTAYAYTEPVKITYEQGECAEQGFDFQFTVGKSKLQIDELPYEHFFVDDTGNVYEINDKNNVTRSTCRHQYTAGTATYHDKNNSRDCTVAEYEALRCSACGYVKRGNEINVLTYKKCPH